MEKNKKRAERRVQHKRKLVKAHKIANRIFVGGDEKWNDHRERWAVRHAENLKKCSCEMCGNPRRLWKDLTMQEKKISQREKFCDSVD